MSRPGRRWLSGREAQDVLRAPGEPLSAPVGQEMQARLGADFSQVPVYADGTARAPVAEVDASAYISDRLQLAGAPLGPSQVSGAWRNDQAEPGPRRAASSGPAGRTGPVIARTSASP